MKKDQNKELGENSLNNVVVPGLALVVDLLEGNNLTILLLQV